jgi:hypothetical protein
LNAVKEVIQEENCIAHIDRFVVVAAPSDKKVCALAGKWRALDNESSGEIKGEAEPLLPVLEKAHQVIALVSLLLRSGGDDPNCLQRNPDHVIRTSIVCEFGGDSEIRPSAASDFRNDLTITDGVDQPGVHDLAVKYRVRQRNLASNRIVKAANGYERAHPDKLFHVVNPENVRG